MRNPYWYRVLIYPTTKQNLSRVVFMQVKGYHWHCARHQRIKCKGCADFEKTKVLHTMTGVKHSEYATPEEVMMTAMASVYSDHVEVLDDGRRVLVLPDWA